jgi:hypothetical protein
MFKLHCFYVIIAIHDLIQDSDGLINDSTLFILRNYDLEQILEMRSNFAAAIEVESMFPLMNGGYFLLL